MKRFEWEVRLLYKGYPGARGGPARMYVSVNMNVGSVKIRIATNGTG